MKINREAEQLGRAAVVAAIAEDPKRFGEAMDAMAQADSAVAHEAVVIYLVVGRVALQAIHQGTLPNEEQNRQHAAELAPALRAWAPVREEDIFALLEGLTTAGNRPPQIPADVFLITLFVTVGALVSWYGRGLGYASFYDFLDDLLDRAETAT